MTHVEYKCSLLKSRNSTVSKKLPVPCHRKSVRWPNVPPDEQILKIHARENRKKEIENNKLFEEVVQMVRQTDYISMDKPLSLDEMAAFAISLYENNIGYYAKSVRFQGFLGDTGSLSEEEIVGHFRKNFKEEIFNKVIRFMLTSQVHFGESNHTNDRTNMAFYTAMQQYHKVDIDTVETDYAEKRDKREKRIRERVSELQKQIKVIKG